MPDSTLTVADLNQSRGGGDLYVHALSRRHFYTEGVRFVAQRAGAYWLVDAVMSHQLSPQVRREEFQEWKLKVQDQKAVLTCTDGNDGVPIVVQKIEFTDFPLPEVVLWLEGGVLMLPGER